MKPVRLRHWAVVLTVAIAVHAALLLRFQVNPFPNAPTTGGRGLQIVLATTPGPPKARQMATDRIRQPKAGSERKPAAPPPKPAPQNKRKEQRKPEVAPAPKPAPKPVSKPVSKPVPKPRKETRPVTQPQNPSAHDPANTAATKGQPPSQPMAGQNTAQTAAQAGSGASPNQVMATGSVSDTPPRYRDELRAWLARHKHYPQQARRRRQQGTVVLYFVITRGGHLVSWQIRKSSGHPLLDQAVVHMIKSANPLPALPSSVHMQRLALTVPVTFKLR